MTNNQQDQEEASYSHINYKLSYPDDPNYDYTSQLVRLNLDEEREKSILSGNGFLITQVQPSLKKELKSPNGIYSQKFGQTLQDRDPFSDRYRCLCGNITGKFNARQLCPRCSTLVEYVDDNFNFFGWLVLNDLYTIHPNLFKALSSFIGKRIFDNIIKPVETRDENGFAVEFVPPKHEPYFGIGIMGLRDKLQEVLDYYNKPSKKDKYNDLVENMDKIFTQSIAVFSTHLRPFAIDGEKFTFEDTNQLYSMMSRLVLQLNDKKFRGMRRNKDRNQLLYDLTVRLQELYASIEEILSGKKGAIRGVFSGRCTFSSRSVIVPGPELRIDEVILPYQAMVELLQQSIVNILQKSYNINYSAAYSIWQTAQRQYDQRVMDIMEAIIKDKPRGIEILINRNPTMNGRRFILVIECRITF